MNDCPQLNHISIGNYPRPAPQFVFGFTTPHHPGGGLSLDFEFEIIQDEYGVL